MVALGIILGLLAFPASRVHAFFTALSYSTADGGNRDILSFPIPPGVQKPTLSMIEPDKLLLTIPGILALPATALDVNRSKNIASFVVEPMPDRKMGLWVTIGLKEPNLNFREDRGPEDPVDGSLFQFEIDKPEKPDPAGTTLQLKEGLVLPGRDGTLLVLSHTGGTEIKRDIEKGSNPVVRLHMKSAKKADTWRPVVPGGLVENVFFSEFPEGNAELEVMLNEHANTDVFFHESAKAGYFILEVRGSRDVGRKRDAQQIIAVREDELDRGIVRPLNRLFPLYEPSSETVVLAGKPITEDYFWKAAREVEKDRRFAKARAYLDSLLDTFPNTPNREIIDFLKLDLARRMDWKPGWLLGELEKAMARHANSANYPQHRFLQLQLINESGHYESALSMMWDPNLPRENAALWLERARANIGLANAHPSEPRYSQDAETQLQKVLALSGGKGKHAALSNYYLAGVMDIRENREATLASLDQLTPEHLAYLGMEPERIMEVADLYYKYGQYPRAFEYYAMFMDAFPTKEQAIPWVMLRAAESSHQLSLKAEAQNKTEEARERYDDSKRLFERLQRQYPRSDAAVWGQIFQLALERKTTFKERLEKLDKVIKAVALPDALSEAYLTRAELLGGDGQYRQSIETLNHLLNMTQRMAVIRRANRLKKDLLEKGMAVALEEGRPEFASLLAQVFGRDWRKDPDFAVARVHLAEALMQMGDNKASLDILVNLDDPAAEALRQLGRTLSSAEWLPLARKEGKLGGVMTREVARVRLSEAERLLSKNEWEAVHLLLEPLPGGLLNDRDRDQRLRLLAKSELGRGRFPHAVRNLETLLLNRPMGDGVDYYGYASVIQLWKGDDRALDSFAKVADEASDKEIRALANIRVGDILQKLGDFENAKTRYLQAAELAPETSWSRLSKENASQLEMVMEVSR